MESDVDMTSIDIQNTSTEPNPKFVNFSELLVRPVRQNWEGRLGYWKRVGTENGLSSTMLNSLSFNKLGGSRAVRMPEYLPPGLARNVWSVEYARCCPHCLSNNAIWRVEWELRLYDACAQHACWLIDFCDKCKAPLTWKRKHLLKCDCGAILAESLTTNCSTEVALLSSTLLRSLVGPTRASCIQSISHLSTEEIQSVIRLFGTEGHLKRKCRSKKVLGRDCINACQSLTSRSAEILFNWPRSFYASLENIEKEFREKEKTNRLADCFGTFYSEIYSKLSGTHFDFIRKAFSNYLVTHWRGSIAERNTRLDEKTRKGAWLPANHACEELKISNKRLRLMIAKGEIVGYSFVNPVNGRYQTFVKGSELPKTIEKINGQIDSNRSANLLGLSKQRMAALRLFLFPSSRKMLTNHNSMWIIERAHVQNMLSPSKSQDIKNRLRKTEVTFGHVMRYWKWSNEYIAKFINENADGKIKPGQVQPVIATVLF